MEKDTGSFEDIARNKLAQAIDDLESADILLGADKYRAANNRAYYAVFHAIDAVLSMEPVAFKKHKDVIAYFNKNYVNKDVFSRDMGRKISKLEIIRHKSDYDDFYIASKLDTVNQVTIAKEIIGEIKTYLNMEQCLKYIFYMVKELPPVLIRSRWQCIMKTQKCHSEERNKIEIVNSETARGEAWGTSRAGTRI